MTGEELFQTVRSNQEFFRTTEGRNVLCDMLIDMGLQEASDRVRSGDSWVMGTQENVESFFRMNFDAKREAYDIYPVDRNFLLLIRKSK